MSLCKVQMWNYAWCLLQTRTFFILVQYSAGNWVDLRVFLLAIILSCTLKCCKPGITISHNNAVRLNPSLLPHQTFLPIFMIFNYIVYIGAIDTTQARQITTDTSGKSSPSHVSMGLQNISTYILSEHSMAAIRYIIPVSFLFYFCAVLDCDKYWYHCE